MEDVLYMQGIYRIIAVGIFLTFLCSFASAATQISLYVDSGGNTEFLGTSDESPILPQGVNIDRGKIEGTTSAITSKIGNLWSFRYSLGGGEMIIFLPDGAKLTSLRSGEVTIERGQIAIYAKENASFDYTVEDSAIGTTWIIWILVILGGLSIGWIWLKQNESRTREIPRKTPNKKQDRMSIISSVLNDREKVILETLKRTGKTKMSFLRRECNLPKASFSRHVHQLAKKKLVTLSGEGRNKFVELV